MSLADGGATQSIRPSAPLNVTKIKCAKGDTMTQRMIAGRRDDVVCRINRALSNGWRVVPESIQLRVARHASAPNEWGMVALLECLHEPTPDELDIFATYD